MSVRQVETDLYRTLLDRLLRRRRSVVVMTYPSGWVATWTRTTRHRVSRLRDR